ncbi:MAG TPA: transporter substrate-binding domain-containing protein, partial [Allocoleopsis sp.]
MASLFAVTLPSCGNPQAANEQGNTNSATKGTLKMATDANYPPYEFYDTASGSQDPQGFDIDIARYITGKLGYNLEIVSMDFSGVIPALQAKRADFAMAGITPTEERKKNIDFSEIYYSTKDAIVVPKGSGITKVEDLSGKNVGAKLGTVQEQAAKKIIAVV